MKKKIFAILILIIIFISGCASINPEDISKSNPIVRNFLKDYPNAEIKTTHFTKAQSQNIISTIRSDCGNDQLELKEYYKITISEPESGLSVLAWLNWDDKVVECATKKGVQVSQLNMECDVERIDIDKERWSLSEAHSSSFFNGDTLVINVADIIEVEDSGWKGSKRYTVYTYNINTKKVEPLATGSGTELFVNPVISKNNILYLKRDTVNSQNYELYLYNLNDKTTTKLFRKENTWIDGPLVTEDGRKIGFVEYGPYKKVMKEYNGQQFEGLELENQNGLVTIYDLGPDMKLNTGDDPVPITFKSEDGQIFDGSVFLGDSSFAYWTGTMNLFGNQYSSNQPFKIRSQIEGRISISGDKIAFVDIQKVKVYDLVNQQEEIIESEGNNYDPKISGNKVIWTSIKDRKYYDIYSYDLNTKQKTKLTKNPYDTPLLIYGFNDGRIILLERGTTQYNLYLAKC